MVDFDDKVTDFHSFQYVLDDFDAFGVRYHRIVLASDIEITLVKFPVSALTDRRVVSSVHLGDLVPLDIHDFVHGHVPCKWHGQIISQGQDFTTLIFQVINKFRIFAVLPGQDFFELEYWGINGDCAVTFEHVDNPVNDLFSDCHLIRMEITGAFGGFEGDFSAAGIVIA